MEQLQVSAYTRSLQNRLPGTSHTAPWDYTRTLVDMTFSSQSTNHCLSIPIHDDQTHESTKSFLVLLSGPDDVLLDPARAIVSITNTDGQSSRVTLRLNLPIVLPQTWTSVLQVSTTALSSA